MRHSFSRLVARLRARLRARLPLTVTALSAVVVAALVAVAVIVAPGYTRQDLHLDDGSVWVANGAQRLVGDANAEIGKLTSTVGATGTSLSILQSPSHLVVHDEASNTLDVIDPAESKLTDTVPLPDGVPEVVSAGSWVAIYLPATGDAWVTRVTDLPKFTAKSSPTMSLGVDATLAIDADGRYVGYGAKSGRLVTGTFGADGAQAATSQRVSFTGTPTTVQATLVSGRPALYDASSNDLWVAGRVVSLRSAVRDPKTAQLEEPTVTGDRVLVGHGAGLVAVSLDDQRVSTLERGTGGHAAAPVRVDDCEYGAWSSGTAVRLCGDASADATRIRLAGSDSGAAMTLAVNGHHVVANDTADGHAWAVQHDGQLIDNWSDFVTKSETKTTKQQQKDIPPKLAAAEEPPVAVADSFGVRPGRANTLPVLLNDSDPNGDPLVITAVTPVSPQFGALDIVNDAQQLQLTTRGTASGVVRFKYTITDGRGGSAQATVTITVRSPGENSAPRQMRPTRTSVASGGTVSLNVLADWVDPDSDPIYLASASTAGPSTVAFTQNGEVTFHDGGESGDLKTISLTVSDGSASGNGTVSVTVGPPGTVRIIAESFAVTGYTGQQIAVAPLPNVRGGTGLVSLDGVSPAAGDSSLRIQPDYPDGSFTVTASRAGSHRLQYSVTDGRQTATGTIRLDVANPPSENLPPITVPTTAFLYLQDSQIVDVLAGDTDPGGGVLSVTALSGLPASGSIATGIVDQDTVKVRLVRTLTGPVAFHYTVSNGKATATGTVTIVQIPEPSRLQAPVAKPDHVTVRVGTVADIPVLDNDVQPNDKPLVLAGSLVKNVPSGGGLLFTAQSELRYLAPEKAGTYTAVYKVTQSDGQFATAPVTIVVKGNDPADDRPPVPETVTARVTAGGTVTIPIPLAGIDPDGDSVSLVGQATAPRLGAISDVGTDSMTYRASSYSSGTDTFQYAVVDSLGQVGTGTIRVGVVPSSGTALAPTADDDLVRTRPGTKLTVNVLDNDSDPAQSPLTVVSADASSNALKPVATADAVKVTAPSTPGSYGVLYTIKNARGATASAWLYISVDRKAPLASPVAQDVVLTTQAVAGKSTVSVDAMKAVTFSEGSTDDLSLHVVPGYGKASVQPDGSVLVTVTAGSQIIPFTVARRDDPSASSTAFIWVPGSKDGKPEIRQDAPALSVVSGSRLVVHLADQLIGVGGRPVRIAGSSSVSATYSNGASLVVDDKTLQYTSAANYFGPASITLTVTDGAAGDPSSQATVTLPITVTPKGNEPPVVNGADITLEAGAQTTVDLLALTDYPYPDRLSALSFSAVSGSPSIATASVSGSTLTVRGVDGVSVGRTARIVVSVRDEHGPGRSGVIAVTIVRSTKPIVAPIPDSVTITRGSSATVDVLANDAATNPFPGRPLHVVSVGGGSTPRGVTVSTSADRSRVSVAVSKAAATGTVTIPYEVGDVTNDPTRDASSTVSVLIRDVPDAPPSAPVVVSSDTAKAQVTLAIPHAFPNYSAITGYTVESTAGGLVASCTNPDACVVSGLAYGTAYSFAAKATNGIGDGVASPASAPVVVDGSPSAPTSVTVTATAADPGGHSLVVNWQPGASVPGSPVSSYSVTVTGPDFSYSTTVKAPGTSTPVQGPAIHPGSSYTASVVAHNKTNQSPAGTGSTTAVGPPDGVIVTPIFTVDNGHAAVKVTWTAGSANGAPGLTYSVQRVDQGAPGSCSGNTLPGTNVSGNTSWIDDNPGFNGAQYRVYATNGLFCSTFTSGIADNRLPAQPNAQAQLATNPDGLAMDIQIGPLSPGDSQNVDHYEYGLVAHGQAAPNSWATIDRNGGFVTGPNHDTSRYGTDTDVYVRACGLSTDDSCSTPKSLGDFTPTLAPATPPATPPTP
ncbi:Ig-like domain-containing protein [Frondihabitans sp. PAMC 28766]|uniref:Ig-like domain-containing protein n=1 Tax=Frondihabitans sp. PAMC 28766 TaxID=1795630 RepID=UPI0012FFAC61|nr:Ig-like domain-containing protein [Frondihabitans sp. PAMC 28766]